MIYYGDKMEKEQLENNSELSIMDIYLIDMRENLNTLSDEETISLSIVKDRGLNAQEILQSSNGSIDDKERTNLEEIISKGRDSEDVLIASLLPLVISYAQKYYEYASSKTILGFGDLVQSGNIGAMKGVRKYDYTKGHKLSTYATWWIRQAITRQIEDNFKSMRIPVHTTGKIKKIKRTENEFQLSFGRQPSNEEIAEILDMSAKKVQEYKDFNYKNISLDEPLSDDGRTLKDVLPLNVNVEEEVSNKLDAQEILLKDFPDFLSPRQADILSRRFGLNGYDQHSYQEIADEYDVTKERARQIVSESIARIKKRRYKMRY